MVFEIDDIFEFTDTYISISNRNTYDHSPKKRYYHRHIRYIEYEWGWGCYTYTIHYIGTDDCISVGLDSYERIIGIFPDLEIDND